MELRVGFLEKGEKKPEISKNVFLSNQCKEIEEKNRMGKIRDLFKKIRNTKGRYLCISSKDGHNK